MKKFIVIVIAIISMFSCLGCNSASQGKDTSKTGINAEVNERTSIAVIQKSVGCSEETAKKYYGQLKENGFIPITQMEFKNLYYEGNFTLKKNSDLVISFWQVRGGINEDLVNLELDETNKKIYGLNYHMQPLITASGTIKKYLDVVVPKETRSKFVSSAHFEINKLLKSDKVIFKDSEFYTLFSNDTGVDSGNKVYKHCYVLQGKCLYKNANDALGYGDYRVIMDKNGNVLYIRIYKSKWDKIIVDHEYN